jgi:transcriptional regulator with XRE-family HTH domain
MATVERQDQRQLLPQTDGRFKDRGVAERFGRNLLKARRRAGFSQEELGKLTSLHRTHIGFMEAGQRLPRADSLVKLTSALTVETDELLRGDRLDRDHPHEAGQLQR